MLVCEHQKIDGSPIFIVSRINDQFWPCSRDRENDGQSRGNDRDERKRKGDEMDKGETKGARGNERGKEKRNGQGET